MTARIKAGDEVMILSGKDKGKTGRVVNVYPKTGKLMVEGINVATRHTQMRMSRRGAQEGGIEHIEMPFDASNAMPVCPECGEPTRVGAIIVDNVKMRLCRKCNSEFD